MNEEKAYWTHEVAKLLSISESTLRKWCIELENQGYEFTKGKNNSRAFLVRDTHILLNIKHLIRTTGLSVEKATQQALSGENVIHSNGSNDTHSSVRVGVRGSFDQ